MLAALKRWWNNMRRRFIGGRFTTPTPTPSPTPTPTPTPSLALPIGTNVPTINWYDFDRPFWNMIYGQRFTDNTNNEVAAADLDATGWVKSNIGGATSFNKGLFHPGPADLGKTFQFTWVGDDLATASVYGDVTNVTRVSSNKIAFQFTKSGADADANWTRINYSATAATGTNYPRNFDVRETDAPADNIHPDLIASLRGFTAIRFMKWSNCESNTNAVAWATRNKPGDASYLGNDGVPVEWEVELCNLANINPWFNLCVGVDDDYVTQFATYARDHLNSGLVAYVEYTNEPWNPIAPYAAMIEYLQAQGIAQGLPGSSNWEKGTYYYAERSAQISKIWATVFSGQRSRFVSLLQWQLANPWDLETFLDWNHTGYSGAGATPLGLIGNYIDAVATNGYVTPTGGFTDGTTATPDTVYAGYPAQLVSINAQHTTVKTVIATPRGKRYLVYEGSPDIEADPAFSSLAVAQSIARDPRAGTTYASIIQSWLGISSDLFMTFVHTGKISTTSQWGLREYAGQVINATNTPKMQAIRDLQGV